MIQVKFKNLENSDALRELAAERISAVARKFPSLDRAQIVVTLEMHNSPVQAGPDLFSAKVHCTQGRGRPLTVEKAAGDLYVALADVTDHLLELLSRRAEKNRDRRRRPPKELIFEKEPAQDSELEIA